MLKIRAFQGLCPEPSLAPLVACVPYDVVNTQEAAALAEDNPYSLLHVDRAEIDLPQGTDIHSDDVYAIAVENFRKLQAEGVLLRESAPCIYLYRQVMGDHSQTGIVATCHIEDYENELIKKHEKTRKDKEDDRTRLVGDLSANTGPIFLTYKARPEIDALVAQAQNAEPLYDFIAPDGIAHTVWRIEGGERMLGLLRELDCTYVADGHHRTASAARVGRERRAANPAHTGDEDYNWFLTVMFPGNQLKILPYNRLVYDLNGLSADAFLDEVRSRFRVQEGASPTPSASGRVAMYLGGQWYGIEFEPDTETDPVARLDVSILQDRLLSPVLGIDDPRTSTRIEFIGGIRGTGELVSKVDAGQGAVAFSMFPTTVDQLMAIADAGQIMPPKSTWFEPKLRSGLFIHTF